MEKLVVNDNGLGYLFTYFGIMLSLWLAWLLIQLVIGSNLQSRK